MYRTLAILLVFTVAWSNSAVITTSTNFISTRGKFYKQFSLISKASVSVEWSGVVSPNSSDYIAMYMDNYYTHVSRKFVNTTTTWRDGYGTFKWEMLNMRQAYYFKYYSGNNVVAQSNRIDVDAFNPMQGHLSVTNNPSEMILKWVSNSSLTPIVRYGFSNITLNLNATGNFSTYKKSDFFCTTNENSIYYFIPPGQIHHVTLTGLLPNTVYYYTYGSADGWSPIRSFRSRSTTKETEFRAIMYGDLGVADQRNLLGPSCIHSNRLILTHIASAVPSTIASIQYDIDTQDYDAVFHIGDISCYAWRWEEFFDQIEPIASKVPYMVGAGNHEFNYRTQPFNPTWISYGGDSGGECGVPYMKKFAMPNNGIWYSVDYPLVHIVVMSSEHDFLEGSEQYKWLENDLKSVNHDEKWIIFTGHRPIYSSTIFGGEQNVETRMRSILEPLLNKYNVDLAIWGHMHNYERTCPIRNGACNGNYTSPNGTVHMVVGSAGAWIFDKRANRTWSQFWKSVYGYIRLNIPDRNTMQIEYQQTSERWTVIDNVTIHYNPNQIKPSNGTTTGSSTTGTRNSENSVPVANEKTVSGMHSSTIIFIVVGSVVGAVALVLIVVVLLVKKRRELTEDSPKQVDIM